MILVFLLLTRNVVTKKHNQMIGAPGPEKYEGEQCRGQNTRIGK